MSQKLIRKMLEKIPYEPTTKWGEKILKYLDKQANSKENSPTIIEDWGIDTLLEAEIEIMGNKYDPDKYDDLERSEAFARKTLKQGLAKLASKLQVEVKLLLEADMDLDTIIMNLSLLVQPDGLERFISDFEKGQIIASDALDTAMVDVELIQTKVQTKEQMMMEQSKEEMDFEMESLRQTMEKTQIVDTLQSTLDAQGVQLDAQAIMENLPPLPKLKTETEKYRAVQTLLQKIPYEENIEWVQKAVAYMNDENLFDEPIELKKHMDAKSLFTGMKKRIKERYGMEGIMLDFALIKDPTYHQFKAAYNARNDLRMKEKQTERYNIEQEQEKTAREANKAKEMVQAEKESKKRKTQEERDKEVEITEIPIRASFTQQYQMLLDRLETRDSKELENVIFPGMVKVFEDIIYRMAELGEEAPEFYTTFFYEDLMTKMSVVLYFFFYKKLKYKLPSEVLQQTLKTLNRGGSGYATAVDTWDKSNFTSGPLLQGVGTGYASDYKKALVESNKAIIDKLNVELQPMREQVVLMVKEIDSSLLKYAGMLSNYQGDFYVAQSKLGSGIKLLINKETLQPDPVITIMNRYTEASIPIAVAEYTRNFNDMVKIYNRGLKMKKDSELNKEANAINEVIRKQFEDEIKPLKKSDVDMIKALSKYATDPLLTYSANPEATLKRIDEIKDKMKYYREYDLLKRVPLDPLSPGITVYLESSISPAVEIVKQSYAEIKTIYDSLMKIKTEAMEKRKQEKLVAEATRKPKMKLLGLTPRKQG